MALFREDSVSDCCFGEVLDAFTPPLPDDDEAERTGSLSCPGPEMSPGDALSYEDVLLQNDDVQMHANEDIYQTEGVAMLPSAESMCSAEHLYMAVAPEIVSPEPMQVASADALPAHLQPLSEDDIEECEEQSSVTTPLSASSGRRSAYAQFVIDTVEVRYRDKSENVAIREVPIEWTARVEDYPHCAALGFPFVPDSAPGRNKYTGVGCGKLLFYCNDCQLMFWGSLLKKAKKALKKKKKKVTTTVAAKKDISLYTQHKCPQCECTVKSGIASRTAGKKSKSCHGSHGSKPCIVVITNAYESQTETGPVLTPAFTPPSPHVSSIRRPVTPPKRRVSEMFSSDEFTVDLNASSLKRRHKSPMSLSMPSDELMTSFATAKSEEESGCLLEELKQRMDSVPRVVAESKDLALAKRICTEVLNEITEATQVWKKVELEALQMRAQIAGAQGDFETAAEDTRRAAWLFGSHWRTNALATALTQNDANTNLLS